MRVSGQGEVVGEWLRLRWAALLSAPFFACVPQSLSLNAPEGIDLLVVGTVSDAGAEVLSLEVVPPRGRVALSAGSESTLFAFGLSHSEIAVNGLRLPEDVELSEVGAIVASDDACGRCRFPVSGPPLVMFSGDRCALPAFAVTMTLNGDRLQPISEPSVQAEAMRRAVRLAWPGPCLPKVQEPPVAESIRILASEPEGRPIDRFAELSDGSIGLFSAESAAFRDPSGALSPTASPIHGMVRDARGYSDESGESFVVTISTDARSRSRTRYDLFRPGMAAEQVLKGLDGVLHREARALSWVPASESATLGMAPPRGSMLVLGGNPFGDNELRLCAVTEPSECIDLGDELRGFLREPEAKDLIRLPSGDLLVSLGAHLLWFDVSADWWYPIALDGIDVQRLHASGNAVVACGQVLQGGGVILTGTVAGALREVFRGPDFGECEEIFESPGRRGVWVRFGSATFDLGPPVAPIPLMDSRVVKSDVPGSVLVLDAAKSLWRDRGEGLEWLVGLGPTPPQATARVAIGDRVEAFGVGGARFSVGIHGGVLDVGSPVASGLSASETPTGVFADGEAWVVSGFDGEREVGFVKTIGTSSTTSIFEAPGQRVLGVAALDAGASVAVGDEYQIWLVTATGVERVVIEWMGGQPPPKTDRTCPDPYQALGRDPGTFRDVVAEGGVAWAVGCEGALVRIAGRRAIQVEVDVSEESIAADLLPPKLMRVVALAPDRVWVVGQGDEPQTEAQGRLFEAGADPDGTWSKELFEAHPAPNEIDGSTSGYPIDLIRSEGGSVIAFDSGAIAVVGRGKVVRYPSSFSRAVLAPKGDILIFTDIGQVLAARLEP